MSMQFIRKLPIPLETKEKYPITEKAEEAKFLNDLEIKKVFSGESDKLLLIIGPCSADNADSVMDYVYRLKKISEQVKDKIIIIPRIYTNKPRTPSPTRGSSRVLFKLLAVVEFTPSAAPSKLKNNNIESLNGSTNLSNRLPNANPVKSKNIKMYLIKFAHASFNPPLFWCAIRKDFEPAIFPKSM